MPHIILNITHISKKTYYFSTNLFQFLINFYMILVLTKCIYKFLLNGNKTRCTTLIGHYMKYIYIDIKTKGPIISKMLYDIWHKIFVIFAIHYVIFINYIKAFICNKYVLNNLFIIYNNTLNWTPPTLPPMSLLMHHNSTSSSLVD